MQDPTEGTTGTTQDTANTAASTPATNATPIGAQPEGTTLDTRAAASESTIPHRAYDSPAVGDRVDVEHRDGLQEAVLLLRADVARLVELAQQVHHFVADEGNAAVKELKIVAAEVGQYL